MSTGTAGVNAFIRLCLFTLTVRQGFSAIGTTPPAYLGKQRITMPVRERPYAPPRFNGFIKTNGYLVRQGLLINSEDYDACVEPGRYPDLSGSLFIRVDASVRNDSTACVAVKYDEHSDRLVLADYKIWEALYSVLTTNGIRLYNAPDLRQHVLNAVSIETPRGIRLSKQKTSNKIDALWRSVLPC
jgi:hypothetical protein